LQLASQQKIMSASYRMRRWLLALLLVLPFAAPAQTLTLPPLTAKSWLLLDVTANHMIASGNPQMRVDPASLTKLMTAYIVFGAVKEKKLAGDQTVPVSERAWKAGGSKMFIEPLKKVTVDELMRGMIIQSGNDASIALAEAVSGSEEAFVLLMNKEAKRLGMNNTSFSNSSGLPDAKHYSTAFDIALLAAAIIRDFPEFYSLYSIKEYRYNNITQPNRNRLLWLDPNVDGVKTGHTEAAGFCLVASAKRGQRRLLSVVMGTPSDSLRAQESQTLLNFGFQFFDTVQVHDKAKPVTTLKVWKGGAEQVPAGLEGDIFVAIPKGTNEKIKAELVSQQPLVAPVSRGQRVGALKVSYDGRPLGEYPVIALQDVSQAGIFGRAWDTVRMWLN
jgi:D-alanyl-D-alanine carboxypeptidase (penicillin-binding protein 5/6)